MSVRSVSCAAIAAGVAVVWAQSVSAAGTYADQVVSYDAGTNRFQFGAYTNPAAALGAPQTGTGAGFVVTPFNNPFSRSDVVSVGLGGQLTLRLGRFAEPVAGAPEIGVFTFQQFLQSPTGGTTAGPSLFYPSIRAKVDVSADGVDWRPLAGGGVIPFDVPANAYRDGAHTLASDYGLPFTGGLDALGDRPTLADTLAAYEGTGGGTWLDISDTGLSHVGFVRFSVPDANTFSFQLEALSVSTASEGVAVPEPAQVAGLIAGAMLAYGGRRRRR